MPSNTQLLRTVRQHTARMARTARAVTNGTATPQDLDAARRDLTAARVVKDIASVIPGTPLPFTPEQRADIDRVLDRAGEVAS